MSDIEEVTMDPALEALNEVQVVADDLRRSIMANRVGFYALGMGVGALTGYFVAKRLLQTKYSQIADDEIADMRRHYRAKERALESEAAKRPIEDIVAERGYSSPEAKTTAPPMAVPPPSDVVENADEVDTPENRQKVVDDLEDAEERVKNVFEEHGDFKWDWHKERRGRSPDIPYVIHIDEREELDGYEIMTLTYYEGDDVLCDERDNIFDPDHERDQKVGDKNLSRFGHGSNDPSVVYVRNDELMLIFEVVKSPNHFAEEVHGFSHDDSFRGNLERMRSRERDDQEE